jgi:hypothetical protein
MTPRCEALSAKNWNVGANATTMRRYSQRRFGVNLSFSKLKELIPSGAAFAADSYNDSKP